MVERESTMHTDVPPIKQEPSSGPTVSSVDIQAMMAAARRQIEEHKLKNGLISKPVGSGSAADRIAELKAQINARLASKASILAQIAPQSQSGSVVPGSSKPAPLILDAEGRTVDSSGKEVQLVHRIPTLKANIRAQKTEPVVKVSSQEKSRIEDEKSQLKFLDARVEAKTPVRPKRSFHFHEKGTFENIAKRMRTKVSLGSCCVHFFFFFFLC